jgi:hypothetical protein
MIVLKETVIAATLLFCTTLVADADSAIHTKKERDGESIQISSKVCSNKSGVQKYASGI